LWLVFLCDIRVIRGQIFFKSFERPLLTNPGSYAKTSLLGFVVDVVTQKTLRIEKPDLSFLLITNLIPANFPLL